MRGFITTLLVALLACATPAAAQSLGAQPPDAQPLDSSPRQSPGAARSLDAPSDTAGPSPRELRVPPPPGAAPANEPSFELSRYPLTSDAAADRTRAARTDLRLPSRITTRMRSLDAGLRALASSGANVVNAVLSLLTGGLSVTLGLLRDPNDDWLSAYLYVYGGAAAARGALELLLSPDAESLALRYQHMPLRNQADVRARLRYGEQALSSLADQAMIARLVDASLNLAAGVAIVPIYLAPNDFSIGSPLDYFVLIGAGVSVLSAIINLVTPSAAEQRWAAYQELRDRLSAEAHEADEAEPVPEPTTASIEVSPLGMRVQF